MSELGESVLRFGPADHLVGILNLPASAEDAAVACLMLNVGVTYRIGPRRLNVKLARVLAEQNIPSLRLDLSGIGDSAAAHGANNFLDQSILDLQAAMDCLEVTTSVRRFVVIGMCSGAVNGYWASLSDKRVVGLMMFDGFSYRTYKTRLIYDWQRRDTWSLASIARRVFKKVGSWLKPYNDGEVADIFSADVDALTPSRSEFASAMNSLDARSVHLYLVFSGSLEYHYNYDNQLFDGFAGSPFLKEVRHDFMPDVDHLPTPLAAQRKLLTAIVDWVVVVRAASSSNRPKLAVSPSLAVD